MKRFIAAVISFAILFSAMPVIASIIPFADIESHWARQYIDRCYEDGILKGTSATTFSPDDNMSLAEGITIAVRLSGQAKKLSQDGVNWYDNAVSEAIRLGIISPGQFDDYTRSSTRAELAAIFAAAMPADSYKAINTVTSLPDVDTSTPYSDAIFKLYRAGVLTGSDGAGTFYPWNNITRAEVSAIVCRLIDEDYRQEFVFVDKPADMTVRTTDKRVNIGGVFCYGVVDIGGKYFVIPQLMETLCENANAEVRFNFYQNDDDCFLSIYEKYGAEADTAYAIDYSFAMPSGIVMGTAQPYTGEFSYNRTDCKGAVYTIDSRMPMISLEALGAKQEGNDFAIVLDKYPSVIYKEADLTGNALWNLQRANIKDTSRAIHDYIVNTLMYDPRIGPPPNMTQEQISMAGHVYENAENNYKFGNNVTLASGYGVCEDYTDLYLEMCLRSGVPCIKVDGATTMDGYYMGHTWNMVYVDGKWQFVDVTWDDPVDTKPTLRHSYYLVDAETMARTHTWDEYPMPTEYDPAWEQLDPNNITSADMWRKCLVAQLMMGKEKFTLRPVNSGAYGGTICIHLFNLWYSSMSIRGNGNSYTFTVEYW